MCFAIKTLVIASAVYIFALSEIISHTAWGIYSVISGHVTSTQLPKKTGLHFPESTHTSLFTVTGRLTRPI